MSEKELNKECKPIKYENSAEIFTHRSKTHTKHPEQNQAMFITKRSHLTVF